MSKTANDLTKFINNIYDSGCHYTSDEPKGCSTYDEEYITALMIQASPKWLQENISDLDPKAELWDMLASYMKCQTLETGSQILQYLVESSVAVYQERIKQQFELRRKSDPIYANEQRARAEEINRELYRFDQQRI